MKLWLIFIQGDDHTWLEAAWDDDATIENRSGWQAEVARCRKVAEESNGQMKIASTTVDGVFELFAFPDLPSTEAGETA